MKTLIRTFLFSVFSLWVVSFLIDGFKIEGDFQILLLTATVFSFIYIFVRPILRLFFLPINLLSLGLLSWLINVAVLYLLTMIVPQVKISAWQFEGFSYQGFVLPAYNFNQIATFIIISLSLSFIINILNWLSK